MTIDMSEYVDREGLVREYKIPVDPLQLANRGRFPKPSLRLSQRLYWWRRSDVERFLAAQAQLPSHRQ